MTFDEHQAYDDGRADAEWMLEIDPDFGRNTPSRESMSDEMKAALGCTLRELVDFRRLTEPMLMGIPRESREPQGYDVHLRVEVWDKLDQLAPICTRAALQAGAPLDDVLPSEPTPEDRYYLQGMDDELKRHHGSCS